MPFIDVLKYVIFVLGIIAVGALIVWGLITLILLIIEPNGTKANKEDVSKTQTITYEPKKLITDSATYIKDEEIKDVDLQKAQEEENALNAEAVAKEENASSGLSEEEELFIKEKQRMIEERLANKSSVQVEEETEEIDLDSIFIDEDDIDDSEEETVQEKPDEVDDEADEDIESLINKILDGEEDSDDDDDDEGKEIKTSEIDVVDETNEEGENEELTEIEDSKSLEEEVEEVDEPSETIIADEDDEDELDDEENEEEAVADDAEDVDFMGHMVGEEIIEEETTQESSAEAEKRILELEQEMQRLKAENEAIIKAAEEKEAQRLQEDAKKIAELEKLLEEKSADVKVGPMLSLTEYEQRLETLKERLKANEKDLKKVKKEYIPLAKIKKTLEKDNNKLRRKNAVVAKQKVMLYGVNNYVDIDEDKAKKLAEDLDLLEGLRLSVQHCEEVMNANAERYPILETSYNSLLETNAHIKADIEECLQKIEELKNDQNDNE